MSEIGKEIYERYQQGYGRGVADERARCIKAVQGLTDTLGRDEFRTLVAVIDAIKASAPTPPGSSSPVGGEQR